MSTRITRCFLLFAGFIFTTSNIWAVDSVCIEAIKKTLGALPEDSTRIGEEGAKELLARGLHPRRNRILFGRKDILSDPAYLFVRMLRRELDREMEGQNSQLPFKFSELFPDLQTELNELEAERLAAQASLKALDAEAQAAAAEVSGEARSRIPMVFNPVQHSEFAPMSMNDSPASSAAVRLSGISRQIKLTERKISATQADRAKVYEQIWTRFLDGFSATRANERAEKLAARRAEEARAEAEKKALNKTIRARTRLTTIDGLRPHFVKSLELMASNDLSSADSIREIAAKAKLSDSLDPKTIDQNRGGLRWLYERLLAAAPKGTPRSTVNEALVYFVLNGSDHDSQHWKDNPLAAYSVNPNVVEAFRVITDDLTFGFESVTAIHRENGLPGNFVEMLNIGRSQRLGDAKQRAAVKKYLQGLFKEARAEGLSVNDSISAMTDYLQTRFGVRQRSDLDRTIYHATYGRMSRYPIRAASYLTKQIIRKGILFGLGLGILYGAPSISNYAYQNDLFDAPPGVLVKEELDKVLAPAEDWAWETWGAEAHEKLNRAYQYVSNRLNNEKPMP